MLRPWLIRVLRFPATAMPTHHGASLSACPVTAHLDIRSARGSRSETMIGL
jgi:hypothetical protein